MTRGRGRSGRLALALLFMVLLVGWAAPAIAVPGQVTNPKTYGGPSYDPAFSMPATAAEGQSKLWYHDQRWWALIVESTSTHSVRVHELMPDHSWRPTSALVATDALDSGDALEAEDGTVHVVTRHADGVLYYTRLTYDPTTHDYTTDANQVITSRGGNSTATIAEDRTGRLWVAFATPYDVSVAYSDDAATWTTIMLSKTGDGTTPEAASIVAFGDRLGLLWSDQAQDSFFFAWHRSGDPHAGHWTREVALSGPNEADNHISLVRVPTDGPDTVAAVVKTSLGDSGEADTSALIKLLLRADDGTWSATPVSTIADGLNDPVLQVDASTDTFRLFATANGSIVEKQAPITDPRFRPGRGSLFVLSTEGVVGNAAVSKDPVDFRSGLVVLASDIKVNAYRHAELPLPVSTDVVIPEDVIPPHSPTALQARALSPDTAILSWAPVTDGDRWSPANDGVPVAGYVIQRDGIEVGTVTSTSLQDRARPASETAGPTSVTYEVLAVDEAGNRSAPARVTVELPAAEPSRLPRLVGVSALVLASIAGLVGARRLWLAQHPPEPHWSVPDYPPADLDRSRTSN